MGAGPGGPDPHFHKSISESFFVLSGGMRLYDGERWIDAAPGDFLFPERVGRAGADAHPVRTGRSARGLLRTLADAARREAMNDEQRAEFFVRHDTYWV